MYVDSVLSSEADLRGVAAYAVLWHYEQKPCSTMLSFECCQMMCLPLPAFGSAGTTAWLCCELNWKMHPAGKQPSR